MEMLKNPITIVLLLYVILGGISYFYSEDPQKTLVEISRLVILFALFISIVILMDRKHVLLPLRAVHAGAILLAPLAFYEGITGNLIWQREHLYKEAILRVNATFVDPNIFARFLILALIANLILLVLAKDKWLKIVYIAAFPVLLAELALTTSRGGVLTLGAILIAAFVLLPNRKTVLSIIGAALLGGVIIFLANPDTLNKLLNISFDFTATNPQRLYLWKAALAIFGDHPLLGTGLGSFQHVFMTDYSQFLTVSDGATVSHTTLLTIAAELGTVGLIIVAFMWVIILFSLYRLFLRSGEDNYVFYGVNNRYYIGTGYVLWMLAIFVSSQGEGRFFEEPLLWLSFGMIVVLSIGKNYIKL
ncbi:MAG: O-antigen ligase family protein, partial [Eubacteriales bacterium]